MGPRVMNAVLGLWLFFSAFLWPHTGVQRVTAWAVGALAVTAALAGLYGGRAGRILNAALAGWLIVSALFLPHLSGATFWTDLVVGVGLVAFAMTDRLPSLRHRSAAG